MVKFKESKYHLSSEMKIHAICWAAAREGKSYGKMQENLTFDKAEQIYKEYLEYKKNKYK